MYQNPALKSFWKTRARNRVLYGGRSSSKSWDAATESLKLADNYPLRILCTRQFQNKIEESVYTLLKQLIDKHGLRSRFQVLKNKIINRQWGSEFLFYGIWRHIEEIKSLEGVDILIIEEAHNLTQDQWDILEPTIRKSGSQIWVIFNPKYVTDFVYNYFILNTPPNTVVRKINYNENPFLSDTALQVIRAVEDKDTAKYKHVYLGEPLSDTDGVIIKRDWVEAAIGFEAKRGAKVIGYDPADGGDANAWCLFDGGMCLDTDQWKGREDELSKSAKRVLETAKRTNSEIGYDSIGVGAHVGSTLNDLGYPKHYRYNAGSKVARPKQLYEGIPNNEFFANLKAQTWWEVADRFRNTYNHIKNGEQHRAEQLIGISPDCNNLEQLMLELCTPKKDYDKLGRVKVESKDDLKARGVESPNLAEAFIIAANRGLMGKMRMGQLTMKGY